MSRCPSSEIRHPLLTPDTKAQPYCSIRVPGGPVLGHPGCSLSLSPLAASPAARLSDPSAFLVRAHCVHEVEAPLHKSYIQIIASSTVTVSQWCRVTLCSLETQLENSIFST